MSDTTTSTFLGPVKVTHTCLFTDPEDDHSRDVHGGGAMPRRHEVPTTPDAAAYKQAGNAVCVGAVQAAYAMLPAPTSAAAVSIAAAEAAQSSPLHLPVPPA